MINILLITILLSLFFAWMVLNLQIFIFILFVPFVVFLTLYLYSKRNFKMFVLSLLVFFPISIPLVFINQLPLIFLISPFLLIFIILNVIVKKNVLFIKENNPFFTVLLFLLIWLIAGYARNSANINLKDKIVIKEYLYVIVGILIYLFNLVYFSRENRLEVGKLLKSIFIVCILLGFLRALAYTFKLYLPFFGEAFGWQDTQILGGGTVVHRIGGVDTCCIIGMSSMLAYYFARKNYIHKYIFIILFIFLGVIGGGRTLFFGLISMVFIFTFITNKKELAYLIGIAFVLAVLVVFINIVFHVTGQFDRIFKLKGLFLQDPLRVETYRYFLNIFLQNPILGKGIGNYTGFISPKYGDFVKKQLVGGGHGAYISTLAIFGIGGIILLSIFMFWGMYKSFYLIKHLDTNIGNTIDIKRLTIFIFCYLFILTINYISGGSGFGNLALYYMIGMLSGLMVRQRHKLVLSR